MKFLWISVILVILSCDKLETSPLPNTKDHEASPYSPQVTTTDGEIISGHTTTVEFELESDEATTTQASNFEEYEDVKVIISKNDTKDDKKIVESENSPFSHKTQEAQNGNRYKRSRESVPNYGITTDNNEEDPGKVFITRIKRPSPSDKTKIDDNSIPVSILRKKNDKNEGNFGKLSQSLAFSPHTQQIILPFIDDAETTTMENDTETTILSTEKTTTQEEEQTTEETTIMQEVITTTETPATEKNSRKRIRNTRQLITTVKDVLTTEEQTSRGTTEESSQSETTITSESLPKITVKETESTTIDSSSIGLTTVVTIDDTTFQVTPLTTEDPSVPATTEKDVDESSTKITTQDRMMTSTMPISVQTESEKPDMTTISDKILTTTTGESTTSSSSMSKEATSKSELTTTTNEEEPSTTEDTTIRTSSEAETTEELTKETTRSSTESTTKKPLTTEEVTTETSTEAKTTEEPLTTEKRTSSSTSKETRETSKSESTTTKTSDEPLTTVDTTMRASPEVETTEKLRTTRETTTKTSSEAKTTTDEKTTESKTTEEKLTTGEGTSSSIPKETTSKSESTTTTTSDEPTNETTTETSTEVKTTKEPLTTIETTTEVKTTNDDKTIDFKTTEKLKNTSPTISLETKTTTDDKATEPKTKEEKSTAEEKTTISTTIKEPTTKTTSEDPTTSTSTMMTETTKPSSILTTMGHQIIALENESSTKPESATLATTKENSKTIEISTNKLQTTLLTHDDVHASQPHNDSLVTKKRSIEKTDANDLTSSSSALHESSDRLSSTEKVTTTKALEEIETNILKSVETTLETPISNEPEPILTTNELTTNSIETTSITTETKTTTTTTVPPTTTTTTTVPPTTTTTTTQPLTTEATTTTTTESTTEASTTTTTTSSTTTASLTETTTPKTSLESVNHNPDPIQCNTSPVFAKGDTIVGGGSINDISTHDKDTKIKGEKDSDSLCTSMECVHSASRMLSRMDLNVDPCNDFYEFSCGKFLAETHVPSEKSNVDIFSTINDNLQQQLQTLLTEPIDPEKDIAPVKVVKKLFKACMNRELIEKRGSKPLMDLLHLLGGWPILTGDSWSGEHWAWGYTVARMKMLGVGVDYIIEMTVLNDFSNSSKRIVYLDQASTELDREFILNGWNDQNVLAYFEFIKDVALALGADSEVADREAREIVNFEISLGQISASKESRRELSSLYNPITIRELQHKHPYMSWLEYINLLLPPKTRVTNDQIISLADVNFFKKLGPLLDNTPKRVLANYLLWHATSENLAYLTENLQKIELKYRSKTSGKDKLDSQWKECVKSIAPKFKVAIGAKYAREYFREDSKKVAVEMVSDIKAAFKEIIQSRDWMDNETKDAAMDKLERMSVNIAYPNELMDDQIVIDYYKGLHVKEDEYFESQLRSDAFLADKNFERLHEPVNSTDWRDLTYVAVVNAFYHPLMNYIMFPAGILQEHFFQADRPKYMNYAAIGFVIGHEITHGFDDMGSQFDVDGNLRNWWQAETLQNYQERAHCMIEQYGNFTDPEVNVTLNGVISQGENIADNGGLKEAYYAYQRWVQKNGDEAPLPGLNYSTNQLFWISAAQTWCTKYKPEALKYAIITDSHSPGRFRVMGPFMNSEAFAKDFDCPRGSRMNPTEKCEVW